MSLQVQFKIKENEYYLNYLRTHSYWYKILNRNPLEFKNFEKEAKNEYRLFKTMKLEEAINTFEMLEKLLVTLN